MTILFALPLAAGLLFVLYWVSATAAAASVEGWEHLDPERRLGVLGRSVLAFLVGFGMAGISALYAGWADLLSIGAGITGGVFLIIVARFLGPTAGDVAIED